MTWQRLRLCFKVPWQQMHARGIHTSRLVAYCVKMAQKEATTALREELVGILHYANSAPQISGILKQRLALPPQALIGNLEGLKTACWLRLDLQIRHAWSISGCAQICDSGCPSHTRLQKYSCIFEMLPDYGSCRYTDFKVNEIDLAGNVAHLTSLHHHQFEEKVNFILIPCQEQGRCLFRQAFCYDKACSLCRQSD